jgi:serine/threonine-protein kinase HipA
VSNDVEELGLLPLPVEEARGATGVGPELLQAGWIVDHRADRSRDVGRIVRVHQEDFCQALSIHPTQKYQNDGGPGVEQMADLLAFIRQG